MKPHLKETILSLELERVINAPRERVWNAWTDVNALREWFCPKGFTTVAITADVTINGAFTCTMRSPAGEDMTFYGTYQDIQAPEYLEFTHAWKRADGSSSIETVVSASFFAEGKKTRIALKQSGFTTQDACDDHRKGWGETLDHLIHYQSI